MYNGCYCTDVPSDWDGNHLIAMASWSRGFYPLVLSEKAAARSDTLWANEQEFGLIASTRHCIGRAGPGTADHT